MNEFSNYVDKGGIIFMLLLIMSAIGLTIIIYKFLELYLFRKNDLEKFDYSLKNSRTISEFIQKVESFKENNLLEQVIDILVKKIRMFKKMIKF